LLLFVLKDISLSREDIGMEGGMGDRLFNWSLCFFEFSAEVQVSPLPQILPIMCWFFIFSLYGAASTLMQRNVSGLGIV